MFHPDHLTIALILLNVYHSSSQSTDLSLCRNGCQLLYHEDLPCDSHSGFIPNDYINSSPTNDIQIDAILNDAAYLCYGAYTVDDAVYIENHQVDPGSFDLNAFVFLWQAIVIAVVIPLLTLLLLRLAQLFWHCALRQMRCRGDSKCQCFAYCLSAKYRQQRRNQKFDEEICDEQNRGNDNGDDIGIGNGDGGNEEEKGSWWKLGNLRRESIEHRENQNDEKHNEYLEVPLNDLDDAGNEKQNVLESVSLSVADGEIEKYLEAPGSGQGVELSFSSHGLRQISYRDVV